jgi:hypothetical protein
MASSGKKKTTFAKLAREQKLRERRLDKQARKDARKRGEIDMSASEDSAAPAEDSAPVDADRAPAAADRPPAAADRAPAAIDR